MQAQDPMVGGFAKWPGTSPDPLHTYFGICGLALLGEECVSSMHPALNISQRAADHLSSLHRLWRGEPTQPFTVNGMSQPAAVFYREKHIAFLKQCLKGLPGQHVMADTSR